MLRDYTEKIKMAGFLLPEDVERLMETELITANMAVLANKRKYIELCMQIRSGKMIT